MTTEKEIDQQIDNDKQKFYNAPYNGSILPAGLLELFKKAYFTLPTKAHSLSPSKVRDIMSKPFENLLTNSDVGIIVNVLNVVPANQLYPSLEEALERQQELAFLSRDYNKVVDELTVSLMKKKARLMQLGGVVPTTKHLVTNK